MSDPRPLADELEARIEERRLLDRALALLEISSFSGHEAAITEAYATMLRDAGLDVEIDRSFPTTPSVIGRTPTARARPGPTLQLAGHLDTVPVDDHPPRIADGRLYGRGAADMKSAMAAFVEVALALRDAGGPRRGSLLITAYGQHEASDTGTLHEPLRGLLRRGIHGDVAIVGDGPNRVLPLTGKGLIIFEIHLGRPGEPVHELLAEADFPNPVMAAHRFVALLQQASAAWTLDDPDVGRDTFFVGATRGGDLYNRVATSARIDGTRRYPPPRTFDDARGELERIAARVAKEHGLDVRVVAHRSGQPFRVDPSDPFVRLFRATAEAVSGRPLPTSGAQIASDINHIVELAGIPTILHGVDATRAHATPEHVPVEEVLRAARVYARVVGEYLS